MLEEGDKDQAIAECLILNELYKNSGDLRRSEQMIREAREINPDDGETCRVFRSSP